MSNKSQNIKGKVVVAMSGGVDSSVTANLLKNQGYSVTGMFMRLGTRGEEKNEAAARAVCRKLNINFYPVNLEETFREEIIKYFIDSYKKGITPNPCVKCNSLIKFGELLKRARELGAEYLATGHYIKKSKIKNQKSKIIYKLFRGEDKGKDQSYFLYTLTQEQLAQTQFPLGNYTKEEVRKIADKASLPYLKSESQDVCFLNQDGKILEHNDYLKKYIKLKPGYIKTIDGEEVGEHQGLPLYTIGQRKGIEIGGTGPYYVARADYKTNTLYVVDDHEHPSLYRDELNAENVNWIRGAEPKLPLKCDAAIRYRHKSVKCEVSKVTRYKIKFKKPQRAVTPGQSIVFYNNNEILGGGVIN